MNEPNLPDVPCLCDECLALWMNVFVDEIALSDAVAAAIADMEQDFQ